MLDNYEYSLLDAKKLLKEGNILLTYFSKETTRVYFKQDKFYIKNLNISLVLNESDFTDLFKNNKFIIEESEAQIDEEKDKEYYSWRQ